MMNLLKRIAIAGVIASVCTAADAQTLRGITNVKGDVRDVQTYMETLRAEVLAGLKSGKTTQELQDTVTMADYKDWGQFGSWRSMNVEGMANYLIKADKVK